jgi:Flp pilus assembly protein TadG
MSLFSFWTAGPADLNIWDVNQGLNGEGRMKKRRSEAGQTIVFLTIGLATFIAAAGLAVDMGYMRYEKRLMQAAADSAAIAGATDQNLGDSSQYVTDAQAAAQANGFQDGVNNVTVNVSLPTLTPGQAVQVDVQQVLPSFFMKIMGIGSNTVSATAIATMGTSPGCIYALQAAGLTLNAGVDAPNCGIVDNGDLNGTGDITAASIGVYGSIGGYSGLTTAGSVVQILQPAADPLAHLIPPTPAGTCNATSMPIITPVTLNPDTYCSGITIGPNGVVTFTPGLYILTGAVGLQITGNGTASNNAGGVTFYNTDSGSFLFNGTGSVVLSASTAGVPGLPPGILFYQDPVDTSAADVTEGGSGNVSLSGTLYFPTASLNVAGAVANTNTMIVAGSITVSGTFLLDADLTSVPGGSPLESVTLVE